MSINKRFDEKPRVQAKFTPVRQVDGAFAGGISATAASAVSRKKAFRPTFATVIAPPRGADSYLAAFAIVGGLRLVTFDQALGAKAPDVILL